MHPTKQVKQRCCQQGWHLWLCQTHQKMKEKPLSVWGGLSYPPRQGTTKIQNNKEPYYESNLRDTHIQVPSSKLT